MRRLLVLVGAILLGGCAAAPGPGRFTIESGHYAEAFDAAREVLRSMRFVLERVDAREGVITTRPKPTAGLVTPWDREQSSLTQEGEDFLNRQQRRVRISFAPQGLTREDLTEPWADLRAHAGPIDASVRVVVDRLYSPNWRVQSASLAQSRHAIDPALVRRHMQPGYAVAVRRDEALERRLAQRIRDRLAQAPNR